MAIDVDGLVEEVTTFLQDDPLVNVLIRRSEFSEDLVKLAVQMMIDAFNQINWRSRFTAGDFPEATKNIQIYGTAGHLFLSAAALQTRNNLPYNDAGTTVAEFGKSGEYSALAQTYIGYFEKYALALKYEMNLAMGWGGTPSEYSYYGGYANFLGNTV